MARWIKSSGRSRPFPTQRYASPMSPPSKAVLSAKSVTTVSVFISWEGITCCVSAKAVNREKIFWCWVVDCIQPCRPSASDRLLSRASPLPHWFCCVHIICEHQRSNVGAGLLAKASEHSPQSSPAAHPATVRYHPPNSDTRDRHAPLALPVVFSVRPAGQRHWLAGEPTQLKPGLDQQQRRLPAGARSFPAESG
ncbi:hypothetical protein D3C78_1052500 [compost metagenome]